MVGTPRKRPVPGLAAAALAVAGLWALPWPAPAAAETVEPLLPEACDKLRRGIENRVPFAPGFRRLRFEFPKNALGIEGHVCRLLTLGTGIHMEGPGIESLKDMRALIHGALEASGWRESPAIQRFREKSIPGREVFGVEKSGAVCVATIVVGMVDGATPPTEATEGGKLHLGRLKPHQREWWISVDCFAAPGLQPQVAAPAPADAPAAAGVREGAAGTMGVATPMPAEPLPPDPTAGAIKETLPAEPEPSAASAPEPASESIPAMKDSLEPPSVSEPMTETIQEAPQGTSNEPAGVLPPEPPLK